MGNLSRTLGGDGGCSASDNLPTLRRALWRASPKTLSEKPYRSSHARLIGVSDHTAGWPDLKSMPHEIDAVARAPDAWGVRVVA